jgi:hypothetical protein
MFTPKENDMHEEALDFNISDIANIKAELDKAIPTLVTALSVADKFASVLDPSLAPLLETAIKVLTAFETVATAVTTKE